eukprot:TRINITY_DN2911_c0_g1_i1.p1 TRINITY_DN2911_c0_g1~~TRINITY_DN2911_c0_g1_i1.p1  ORF type:complete len:612 (+),score=232.06 TRINITY_DN2911_c0_g1_i1:159-1994(+)
MNPNAAEFKFTPSAASAAPFVPRFGGPPPGIVPAAAPAPVVAVPAPAPVVQAPPPPQPEPEPEASWEETADKSEEPAAEPAKPEPAPELAPRVAAVAASPAASPAPSPSPKKTADDFKPTDEEVRKEIKRIAAESGVSEADLLKDDADVDSISDAIADVKIDEAVADDTREHLHVVFIGHVDAGKSTISGNILFLTGQVDARTVQKYEQLAKENNRESWFFAYIMDTNEEERAKGKTVEVGRAHFETTEKRYTILDAPGHKNYVPNMIGGASQADVAVLVISARKGEFDAGFRGGQTKEHAMLVKTLGVKYLICVINKMDDPTVGWSQERYDEIVREMNNFLRTIGFNLKADVYYIPVSGLKGSNIKDHSTKEEAPWYTGPTLLGQLDLLKPLDRNAAASLRIPVIDKGKDRGATQVMGKVEAGTLRVGDKLIIVPNNIKTECLGLFMDEGRAIKTARSGESVKVLLKGVEEEQIHTGFVICNLSNPVPCQTRFEAMLNILELLPHKPIFTPGYTAVIHIHTAVEECSILVLVSQLDKKNPSVVAKKRPTFVTGGALVRAIIECAQPVAVELFADCAQLGRFTLRDEGKTIAVGKVMTLQSKKSKEAAGKQ